MSGFDLSADALYLHIPFCKGRCAYCAFPTSACSDEGLMKAYCESLVLALRRASRAGLLAGIQTAYVGGGTPTHVGGRNLTGLLYFLGASVPREEETFELTVECNPESVTLELARDLFMLGANRFSLGVQSFDDAVLARIGRVHTASQALSAIEALTERGARCSVDLICGFPGQTPAGFAADIARAVDAGVDHVSVYPLTVEEGTPLFAQVERGEMPEPDEDAEAEMMLAAAEALSSAGLERYEVASYARPGSEARHNTAYWTGKTYVGLGPGAAGMLTPAQFAAACDCGLFEPCELPACADGGEPARVRYSSAPAEGPIREASLEAAARFAETARVAVELECLSEREAAAEDLMLGMRLVRGVDEVLIAQARGLLDGVDDCIEGLVADGLATWRDGRLTPTQRGWLLGNELFGRLWDLAS